MLAVVGLGAPAQAATGYRNCGTAGHVIVHSMFARNTGLHMYAREGTGPRAPYSLSARVNPNLGIPDPDEYLYNGAANWLFATNIAKAHYGIAPARSGTYAPSLLASQCTGQAAPTGKVVKTVKLGSKTCPVGRRPVVWADGWGNHWVSYRSSAGAPWKRAQTMRSNYRLLWKGALFIDDRSVYDVKIQVTTTKASNWAENWMPTHYLRCGSDREDPRLE